MNRMRLNKEYEVKKSLIRERKKLVRDSGTRWPLGLVVARWSRSTKLLYAGSRYITKMGNRLRAGKPPRFVTSHSGQFSHLPSAGRKMSTSQNAVTLYGWGVKAQVWFIPVVKLCDPSLTRAIPERFRDQFLVIKRYTNLRCTLALLLYKLFHTGGPHAETKTSLFRWHL